MNVGHGPPFIFQRRRVGGVGIFQRFGRANRQRGRRLLRMPGNQRIPGRHVGIAGGVNLEQRVAVRIEELDALAAVVVQAKSAGPLAEKQAQIEGARIKHQPGVAAQMLMGKFADLLMHRVFVAADAFGFPHGFQRRQNGAGVVLQTYGIVAQAGFGQLGFANPHFGGDIAGVFRGRLRFRGQIALPQRGMLRLGVLHNSHPSLR